MKFLDREASIAKPGFNRWLVPPAALAVHLAIGQIYAYSVFNAPLTKLIGITESAAGDWKLTTVGWIFSIALAMLGASAALFGTWMERVGPRKAIFAAACCFSLGFFVSAFGVRTHNLFLLYLGNGVIGGVGLGLGYVGPVSTLMKWFPDKPGMATGLAIMGFGGGAMLASPLSVSLMNAFSNAASVGVAETFAVLGLFYLALMMFGAFTIRVPADGWKPEGYTVPKTQNKPVSSNHVNVSQAMKTPQFWLLFWVLCLNVTAGIGVLGQASVMIQELFSETSAGRQAAVGAGAAAGFVSLLSLFNMGGRFLWSSVSDKIGRKNTYTIFFVLGSLLYFAVPSIGEGGSKALFIIGFCVIISMYGGGFAATSRLPERPVRHLSGRRDSRAHPAGLVNRRRHRPGTGQLHTPKPNRQRHTGGTGIQRNHVHYGGIVDCRTVVQPRRQIRTRKTPRKRHQNRRTQRQPRRRNRHIRRLPCGRKSFRRRHIGLVALGIGRHTARLRRGDGLCQSTRPFLLKTPE